MDWSALTVQLLTAFLGAFGYALLFQVSRDKLFGACAGGFLAWLVYLLCGLFSGSNALKYFIASDYGVRLKGTMGKSFFSGTEYDSACGCHFLRNTYDDDADGDCGKGDAEDRGLQG